MLQIDEPID